GPSENANLINVTAVAHDPNNNIYVGDSGAGRIRRIDATTGIIETIAGTGTPGYGGDKGRSKSAQVGFIRAMRFDGQGNLYFLDQTHHVIRRIDVESGIITTIAGTGEAGFSPDGTDAAAAQIFEPCGLAISNTGQIYFSDTRNNRVRRITRNGKLETVAGCHESGDAADSGPATVARLNEPYGLCFYGDKILLICDHWNNKIRAVKV
ncbi:uncharacterized protein METZ01_LOCUS239094, partial [marine metagenome]